MSFLKQLFGEQPNTEQIEKIRDLEARVSALDKSQAVIEFKMDGTIVTANENFLNVTGYRLDEIRGRHHSLFVDQAFKDSAEYRRFWENLNAGQYQAAEYKRLGKGGREVWLQASYNPIFDANGKPCGVVKYATDISAQKKALEEYNVTVRDLESKVNALDKSQAVIEFKMDGTIVSANDNFLNVLGYRLEEIQGKHHSIFVEPDYKNSLDYRQFWETLNAGQYQAAEYKRIAKGGREIWIQGSYNPVCDSNGKPYKVVKYATDITEQKLQAQENERIANIANALTLCQANVMLANNDMEIIYMNDAVKSMLTKRESDLQKSLPQFRVDRLMGANVDVFHRTPSHQRHMMESLREPVRSRIEVSGLTFTLTASPWKDQQGNRIGTVVEWLDRTVEVAAEKEIDAIVEAASKGDLSRRIETHGKEGFLLKLGEGLNRLLTISDSVVSDTIRVFDALAHGNLTRRIDDDYQGAFNKLKQDANATVERLTDIITRIRESASTVSTGASEIAQGNADLSRRTESQASSLEETASSMEEMTSAVKQTGDNSVHANELASAAKLKAQTGGRVVSKAVTAMEEINSASKKIADIISVIDEIAFQTNLLALNAAVEAARAGEQGRGFAVVAGEVRNLAQRSAGAAREIKDLIRDSVDKVDAGTSLVNESGRTLNEIIDAVDRVSEMIREISTAAREQSAGIEQVNSAVAQMDEMTQQNAALVEEASAAGEAMAEQARSMMEMMEFFTIDGHQPMHPIPASQHQQRPATRSAPVTKAKATGTDTYQASADDDWAEF
jgi:methyl-accepting chemotaxis protein